MVPTETPRGFPQKTLDNELETALAELDQLRVRSAALRDQGRLSLWDLVEGDHESQIWERAEDQIEEAVLIATLHSDERGSRSGDLLSKIQKLKDSYTPGDDSSRGTKDQVPLFTATRTLQALALVPGSAFSPAALSCLYSVLVEIYSAEPPDWAFGGVRAGDGGTSSAFMTNECIRAIVRLSKGLESLAGFLSRLVSVFRYSRVLRTYSAIPPEWVEVETERILLTLYTGLRLPQESFPIIVDPEHIPNLHAKQLKPIEQYLQHIVSQIAEAATQTSDHASNVARLFRSRRSARNRALRRMKEEEEIQRREAERREVRRATGELIAGRALKMIANKAEMISQKARNEQVCLDLRAEEIAGLLRTAAYLLHQLLEPARVFVSRVLDRQLASAAEGLAWDRAEMTFAAVAYGWASVEASKPWTDVRLARAARYLQGAIDETGRFATGRPIFATSQGYLLVVSGCEVLRALAELLRRVDTVEVEPTFARRMLAYFEHLRVDLGYGRGNGLSSRGMEVRSAWHQEEPVQPVRPSLWATSLAVQALARMNLLLDERINQRVFGYFSVQHPDREAGVALDDLFYVDYGLRYAPSGSTPKPGMLERREPVAFALERMRAHVMGTRIPRQDWEPLFSLILHGPAGTGKTTLVESLALSSGVPLVQVTPSDIVMGGAEEVEQRARAVFKALSLLTRTVILFDEFDPILARRDPGATHAPTVFSFVTPGMLPKLKTLHNSAKKRSLSYVLITNYIGSLDEAAVRTGRFDEKLGIYPPDPLSRIGRLTKEVCCLRHQCPQKASETQVSLPDDFEKRICEVVVSTAGAPIEALVRPGWFTRPRRPRDVRSGTPFAYLLASGGPVERWPEPEDELRTVRGEGRDAKREFQQWSWIVKWDTALSERPGAPLKNVVDLAPRAIPPTGRRPKRGAGHRTSLR